MRPRKCDCLAYGSNSQGGTVTCVLEGRACFQSEATTCFLGPSPFKDLENKGHLVMQLKAKEEHATQKAL